MSQRVSRFFTIALSTTWALGIGASGSLADSDLLRKYPYPHESVISFASDADSQPAWLGAAMHRVLNEELGMPISDSVFVISSRQTANESALFRSVESLHNTQSGYYGHSIFGLLLREWHRGNIDHLHTWYNDILQQFRFELPEPLGLSAEPQSLQLPQVMYYLMTSAADPGLRGYQQFRLMFDRPPPDDLKIALNFVNIERIEVEDRLVRQARRYQDWEPGHPYALTLFLNTTSDLGVVLPEYATAQNLVHNLLSVELWAPSCSSECPAKLLAVERDNYNRATALIQREMLKSLNIRPLIFTSHGGYTRHQSYGVGVQTTFPSGPEHFRKEGDFLAGQKGTHAYISDILRDLGVHSISSLDSQTPIREWRVWHEAPQETLASNYEHFYILSRTYGSTGGGPFTQDDAHERARQVLRDGNLDPDRIDVSEYFCTTSVFCYDLHMGSQVGFNLHSSLDTVRSGRSVEHLWYQHFGVSILDPELQPTIDKPWAATARHNFRLLSDHYYNFSGTITPEKRIWVPAAAQWQTYRIMHSLLSEEGARSLSVDPVDSVIHITSRRDAVTERVFPDPTRGIGDLQGITIYVPDAEKASIRLDGQPVRTFTRNPADNLGRESVTIVSDRRPSVVFDEVALDLSGSLRTEDLRASMTTGDAAYGSRYLKLTAQTPADTGKLTHQPGDLSFWNATHLHFAMRKRGDARIRLHFSMENGAEIVAEERPGWRAGGSSLAPAASDAGWFFPAQTGPDWQYVTLALDQIRWTETPDGKGQLPLPIGKVNSVTVEVIGSGAIDLDGLKMLSPSVNAEPPDRSKLIAGRVTENGIPVVGTAVVLIDDASRHRREAATDRFGYYYFPQVPFDSIMRVEVDHESGICQAPRGVFGVYRDEAEVDVDISRCGGT